jgi:hypothetical protein
MSSNRGTLIWSSKPRQDKRVRIYVQSELDIAARLVRREYPRALQKKRNAITLELVGLHKHPSNLSEAEVSQVFCKICDIARASNSTLREVCSDIKSYIGAEMDLFNSPLLQSLEKIEKAYSAVKGRYNKAEIMKILQSD